MASLLAAIVAAPAADSYSRGPLPVSALAGRPNPPARVRGPRALGLRHVAAAEALPVRALGAGGAGGHVGGNLGRARRWGRHVAGAGGGRRRWFDGDRRGLGREFGDLGPFPWERDPQEPWEDGDDYSPPETVSFVTSEGVYTLQSRVRWERGRGKFASKGARDANDASRGEGQRSAGARRWRRQEEDYMDPVQRLCLGAVFDIRALNGVSEGRYFCVDGFCRSVHMLSDVIADVVEEEGGEVLAADVSTSGGLNERLRLRVVMPLLWGVPPKRDALRRAIHDGGGIVHRCFQEWQFQ